MPSPARQVPPLDVDAVRTVQVGTLLWTGALILALGFRGQLAADGRTWWLWTCVAGMVLGALGIVVTTRRRRRMAHRTVADDSA